MFVRMLEVFKIFTECVTSHYWDWVESDLPAVNVLIILCFELRH